MTNHEVETRTAFDALVKLGQDMGMKVVRGEEYLRILPAGVFDPDTKEIPNQFWHDQAEEAQKVVADGDPCSIALPAFMKNAA